MALTLLLKCKDLETTRSYYETVLGFTVQDSAEGSLTVEREGARLIFTAADLWQRETGLSGTIYIGVKEVDSFYASLEGRVQMSWPLQVMSYGTREFGVTDCNGYILAFHAEAR